MQTPTIARRALELTGFVLVACVAAAPLQLNTAAAEPFTFDNDCGNLSWFAECSGGSERNWNPERLPAAEDDVTIPASFAVRAGSGGGTNQIDIKSLNAPGGLTLTQVNLLLREASAINSFVWRDAVVSSPVGGQANGLNLFGNSSWQTNGTLRGQGATANFRNAGNLEIVGLGILERATFVNAGMVTQPSELRLHPNALARNQSSWTLNNGTLRPFNTDDPPGALFDNDGALRNTGGFSNINLELVSDSPGTIDVMAGSLMIGHRAIFGGDISIAANATLAALAPALGQIFRNQVNITGGGQMNLSAGPGRRHRIEGALSNNLAKETGVVQLNNVDIEIAGTGSLTNRGVFRWGNVLPSIPAGRITGSGEFANETGGVLSVGADDAILGAKLTNKGMVEQHRRLSIDLASQPEDVAILNEAGSEWTMRGTEIQTQGGGLPVRFRNLGALIVPSMMTATIKLPFELAGNGQIRVRNDARAVLERGGNWSSPMPLAIAITGKVELRAPGQAEPSTYTIQADAEVGLLETTLAGDVDVLDNATLRLEAKLVSQAGLRMNGGAITGPGTLENRSLFRAVRGQLGAPRSALQIDNRGGAVISGEIPFHGSLVNRASLTVGSGARLTLEADSTISNTGKVDLIGPNQIDGTGSIRNEGVLGRDASGSSGAVDGTGAVQSTETSTVAVAFDNPGHVLVAAGVLALNGGVAQVQGATLTGGRWTVLVNGVLRIGGATIETIGPAARIWVGGTSGTSDAFANMRRIEGMATLFGLFRGQQLTVAPGGTAATSNRTTPRERFDRVGAAAGGAPEPVTPMVFFDLDGGSFLNEGAVVPGEAGDIAAFGIDGDYAQTSSGVLSLEIAADRYEQLTVTGEASLGGTLEVSFLEGYLPQPQDVFVIVAAGSVTGRFGNAVDRLYLQQGAFDVTYDSDTVTLSGFEEGAIQPTPTATPDATCFGDCGADGRVTVDEVLTLVNIALGNVPMDTCLAGDAPPFDGRVTVDEILTAVNRALTGC